MSDKLSRTASLTLLTQLPEPSQNDDGNALDHLIKSHRMDLEPWGLLQHKDSYSVILVKFNFPDFKFGSKAGRSAYYYQSIAKSILKTSQWKDKHTISFDSESSMFCFVSHDWESIVGFLKLLDDTFSNKTELVNYTGLDRSDSYEFTDSEGYSDDGSYDSDYSP